MDIYVQKVTIPVRNQDEAIRWYQEKLGFKLLKDEPFAPGARWVEMRSGENDVTVVLFAQQGKEVGHVGEFQPVLFTSKDVDAAYRAMSGRGVSFPQPPKREAWGVSAIFQDLDGNSFSLASAA